MPREKIKLLIVDDNRIDIELVRTMLRMDERATFVVDSVGTTQECLEAVRHATYDLILLDHGLPGEDGLTLLRRLSGMKDVPPVIMMTGQGDEQLAAEAMRMGASDYYPKSCLDSRVLGLAIHQALEKWDLNQHLENTERVIFALAMAVEAKDPTTEQHIQRLASFAAQLGEALGLSRDDRVTLRYGGILHDIGKVGVSEAILRKPGPLTDDEWQEMRRHPIIGEEICAPLRFANKVGPILRHHHERWDGTGYVDLLKGKQIPLLARIVSVVDSYDAMSFDRPYRKALPEEEVIRRLEEGSGSQWDPDVVNPFLDLVRKGDLVHLDGAQGRSRLPRPRANPESTGSFQEIDNVAAAH